MKVKIANYLFTLLLICSFEALSQNLKKVVTYYDIYKTKVHESYTTLATPPYLMHGVYEKYDAYGALMTRGNYSEGKKNGKFTNYFSTEMTGIYGKAAFGKVWSESNYVNEKENGLDKLYSVEDGQQVLIKQITWVMGTKTKDEEWDEKGKQKKLIQPDGPCYEYYSNGNKKTEYTAKGGKFEGKYTSWYPSGQIEVSTTYSNDIKNGKHVEYFANGKPELEANYVKGNLSGLVTLYFDNGKTRKVINYDPSTLNLIEEKEYATNGLPKFERKVISGNQCKSITYDSIKGNKILEQEEIFDQSTSSYIRNGKVIKYHSNGKIYADGTFVNGNVNGPYKEYDDTGELIKSGEFDNGESVGEWLYYYDKDFNQVASKSEAVYFRKIDYSSPNGPWPVIDYFITGEKQFQGALAKVSPDVPSGKCIYYLRSGVISQELELDRSGNLKSQKIYLESGKLDKEATTANTMFGPGAEWIEYYPDGKIRAQGKTFDGQKVGLWTYFDENGNSRQVKER